MQDSWESRKSRRRRSYDNIEPDTISAVLTIQVLICVVLLLLCIFYRKFNSEDYSKFKIEYSYMLSKSGEDENMLGLFGEIGASISGSVENLEDFFLGIFGKNMPQPDNLPPENEAEIDENDPVFSEDVIESYDFNYFEDDDNPLLTSAGLSGAGGEIPVDYLSDSIPANCTLSEVLISAVFRPPVSGRITSPFGFREHPLSGEEDFHKGMDIAAKEGAPVLSALPGTVAETGYSDIYGNYIILRHSKNVETFYAHCSEIIAKEGMVLKQGQRIAKVGNTGISTGPHLHFAVIVDDVYTNPYYVLKQNIKVIEE